jgi:glycosyltransferase involved in cell wall biosynthesis
MSKKNKKDYLFNVWLRQLPIFYKTYKNELTGKHPRIIGLIRERNEALILQDTLDHMSQFVDGVIVFDDASSDESVAIARKHPLVIEVIVNKQWRKNRVWEETSNRKLLHDRAKKYNPEWFFYFDADERFEGDIKNYLLNECPETISAIRISLFDAYITKDDKQPFTRGKKLLNFRKYFGPERRDILMIWRNGQGADFVIPDAREPQGIDNSLKETKFYCQHYGKALSINHWEETCKYYIDHFPKYAEKWRARVGRAIHDKSDFGMKLYTWPQVKRNSVDLKTLQS